MLVKEILYHALRRAGVIQLTARTASQAEMDDAFANLNWLMDSFLADGLLYYSSSGEDCNLTASKGVYTIGPGGEFPFPRPSTIAAASVVHGGDTTEPVKPLNVQQWAALDNQKEISSFGPDFLYYESSLPLGKIHIAPMPMAAMVMTIYVPLPIAQFSAQDSIVTLPPAYLQLIIYNLAVQLSTTPRFRRFPMDPIVPQIAAQTRDDIRRFNADLAAALGLGLAPAAAPVEAHAK
jgi:hypothetical protein